MFHTRAPSLRASPYGPHVRALPASVPAARIANPRAHGARARALHTSIRTYFSHNTVGAVSLVTRCTARHIFSQHPMHTALHESTSVHTPSAPRPSAAPTLPRPPSSCTTLRSHTHPPQPRPTPTTPSCCNAPFASPNPKPLAPVPSAGNSAVHTVQPPTAKTANRLRPARWRGR